MVDFTHWVGNGLKLCQALQVGERRTKLQFNFSKGSFNTTNDVCEIMKRHLTNTMTDLSLSFRECEQLSDVSAVGTALLSLAALQKLNLSFSCCKQLSDVSAVGTSLASLTALQELSLSFDRCSQLPEAIQKLFDSHKGFLKEIGTPRGGLAGVLP